MIKAIRASLFCDDVQLSEDNNIQYRIDLKYGQRESWKVNRSGSQIMKVISDMKQINPGTSFSPVEGTEYDTSIIKFELSLNEIFTYYGEDIWDVESLVTFVDDSVAQSVVNTIQMRRMNEMVSELQDKSAEFEAKYNVLESRYCELLDILHDMKANGLLVRGEAPAEVATETRLSEDAELDEFSGPISDIPVTRPSLLVHVRNNASPHGQQRNPNRLSFLSAVTTDSAMTNCGTETSESVFLNNDQGEFSDEEEALIRASFVSWEEDAIDEAAAASAYDDDLASITAEKRATPIHQKKNVGVTVATIQPKKFASLSPLFPNIGDNDEEREDEVESVSMAVNPLVLTIVQPIAQSIVQPIVVKSDEDVPVQANSVIEESAPKATEASPSESAESSAPSLPHSQHLSVDLFPSIERCQFFSEAVRNVMACLEPHETQVLYRSSALGFLQRQVRISSGSNGFDVSLNVIHCSLPDDPLKLSVVQSKNHSANWHLTLTDRLTLLSERGGGSHTAFPDEEDVAQTALLANRFDDHAPLIPHFVTGVAHSKQSANHQVHCVVDSLEVEIVSNNRADLCMLAFLEEFSGLVGQDHLFKRSLLLIRAWWVYETAFYVGCAIKHYLSDFSLCIMMCAIFNQYHAQIGSPLQALCLFLTEYSGYDGSTHAITLQGVVPFQSATSNQPLLVRPRAGHLVGPEMTAKYWEQFNIAAVTADVQEAETEAALVKAAALAAAAEAASVSSSPFGDNSSGSASSPISSVTPPGSASMSNVSINSNDYYNTLQSSIVLENRDEIVGDCIRGLASNNLFYFERLSFSIVHPFTNMNCIDKLSQRRLARLDKAFQMGATILASVLKNGRDGSPSRDVSEDHSTSIESMASPGSSGRSTAVTSDDLFRGFFPVTAGRFSEKWRPDAINNSIAVAERYHVDFPSRFAAPGAPVRDLLQIGSAQLWEVIRFCNLMLEAVLSESALQNLATEILAVKGPLPVGEIGKILAELTSIGNLSQKLKEKFGGLKKFLEHFPASFVIFNDHPFNPNVLLRRSLTAEQLDLIDRGIFPHQLLLKAKKGAVAAKKKSKSLSLPSSSASVDMLKQQQRQQQHQYNGGHNLSSGMSAAAVQNAKYQQTLMRNAGNGLQGLKSIAGKPSVSTGYATAQYPHQPRAPLFSFFSQQANKFSQQQPSAASSGYGTQNGFMSGNHSRPAASNLVSSGGGGGKDLVELGFLSAGREFNEQQGALSSNSYFALAAAINSPPPGAQSGGGNPFLLTHNDDLVLPGESHSAMLSSLRVNSVQLPRTYSGGDLSASPTSPLSLSGHSLGSLSGLGLASSPPHQHGIQMGGGGQHLQHHHPFGQHAYYASTNSLHMTGSSSSSGVGPNGQLFKQQSLGGSSRSNSDSSPGQQEGGGFNSSFQQQSQSQSHNQGPGQFQNHHQQQHPQQQFLFQQQQHQQYSAMDNFLHSGAGGHHHGGGF